MADEEKMAKDESYGQLIWGGMLAAMGLALIFRIPQVMPRITQIDQFANAKPFLLICFYLMAIILIGGGCRKIYTFMKLRYRG
jgi:Na+/proline symporter